jgi:hypothetical protein
VADEGPRAGVDLKALAASQREPPVVSLEGRPVREGRLERVRVHVAGRTGVNEATLYRIETAKARPQTRTLTALLDLYDVPGEVRAKLAALARQSAEQSWLQSFPSELPEPYPTYISLEGEARSLLNHESLFIPGLLQFDDPGASDVVYVESGSGDLFMESQADVSRFITIFEHLRALALPPDASAALVMSAARDP